MKLLLNQLFDKLHHGLSWPLTSGHSYKPCITRYKPCITRYKPCITRYKPCITRYKPCITLYKPCITCYGLYESLGLVYDWIWSGFPLLILFRSPNPSMDSGLYSHTEMDRSSGESINLAISINNEVIEHCHCDVTTGDCPATQTGGRDSVSITEWNTTMQRQATESQTPHFPLTRRLSTGNAIAAPPSGSMSHFLSDVDTDCCLSPCDRPVDSINTRMETEKPIPRSGICIGDYLPQPHRVYRLGTGH